MEIFTEYDLMVAVEDDLKTSFENAEYVEVTNFKDNVIYFDLKIAGLWYDGKVRVDYDTDLAVYVKWNEEDGFSYQFDVLWCDILPEEVE